MSTDQICAYCDHSATWHMYSVGSCGGVKCPCPRFIPNTDTETHEVTAQVLAEDAAREVGCAPIGAVVSFGGTHFCDCGSLPEHPPAVHDARHETMLSPATPSERRQSRATKLSILVFDCVDQAIQAARAGRVEDAEEWRDLAKQVDEL